MSSRLDRNQCPMLLGRCSTQSRGLSEKILTSQYENNYTGTIKRPNAISEQLAPLDYSKAPAFVTNGLKREELIATNSMILREIYFVGPGEESYPGPTLADSLALVRDFGTVDRWRAEFIADGQGRRCGSGWVILARTPRHNCWASDHATNRPAGSRSRPRYVRTRLSYGRRRQGWRLRWGLHDANPLGQRRPALRASQPSYVESIYLADAPCGQRSASAGGAKAGAPRDMGPSSARLAKRGVSYGWT